MKDYITRNGVKQFKPSLKEVMAMMGLGQGFCVACGHWQEAVEPDIRKGECDICGAHKVYGGHELVTMGLTY